jgi:FixJ family two-component response regulator
LLIEVVRKGRFSSSASSMLSDEDLSGRESDVLRLLAAGASNRDIAALLGLPMTAKLTCSLSRLTHVKRSCIGKLCLLTGIC